jgi:SCP-2 sterol transfer family
VKTVKVLIGEVGRSSRGRGARSGASGPAEVIERVYAWGPEGPEQGASPGDDPHGPSGEPDLTLSLSPADAEAVRRGDLAPSVAFMQGRLKTAGDNALLLEVLAWTATPAFAQALGRPPTSKEHA